MRGCFVGWRFAYPTYDSCDLPLIYSPALLKLPGLAASKRPARYQHGILDFAGWRLHLTRPTAPNHRWRWGR